MVNRYEFALAAVKRAVENVTKREAGAEDNFSAAVKFGAESVYFELERMFERVKEAAGDE